jgi:selenium donor protein
VEKARSEVAQMVNASPDEIIFTSGGSEANNHALKGVAFASEKKGRHIITTAIEHPAILEVCRFLGKQGVELTFLGTDEYGIMRPEDLENEIRPETILISVMHANNETGSIQPVGEISRIARQHGILIHTDAAQSIGKIPVDVQALGVDLLSVAGHKFYAPKGVGALYIRRGVSLEKLIHGADHEANRRAGTENVPSVVGLGPAAGMIADSNPEETGARLRKLRDLLHQGIAERIPEVRLNGHPVHRLPNTLSLGFPGVEAGRLLKVMDGVAVSAGAACHAGQEGMSGVLAAMKVDPLYAMGTIRFSVGRMTTEDEIRQAADIVVSAYKNLTHGMPYKSFPVAAPDKPEAPLPHIQVRDQFTGETRLTNLTLSPGCACKIRPDSLEKLLRKLPVYKDPNILVGTETSDDASVYRINEHEALVLTVDVIPPVVDDPYAYGAIAAANALSDIYAMGAKPLCALNITGFPESRLPIGILEEILRGAADKAAEAGIPVTGGHSVDTAEPLFGLSVAGIVHPSRIIRNVGIQPGDVLILTKPLGSGILTSALKQGLLQKPEMEELIAILSQLNRQAAETMLSFDVHACTDVTGFGLLGHLKEMINQSDVIVELAMKNIPVIEAAWRYAAAGAVSGSAKNNLVFAGSLVEWGGNITELAQLILADPQTSGGLLISLPEKDGNQYLDAILAKELKDARLIGKIVHGKRKIRVS